MSTLLAGHAVTGQGSDLSAAGVALLQPDYLVAVSQRYDTSGSSGWLIRSPLYLMSDVHLVQLKAMQQLPGSMFGHFAEGAAAEVEACDVVGEVDLKIEWATEEEEEVPPIPPLPRGRQWPFVKE